MLHTRPAKIKMNIFWPAENGLHCSKLHTRSAAKIEVNLCLGLPLVDLKRAAFLIGLIRE
jgi:hypothetical protein